MDVMREANVRAAEGVDIIHMEVGQPGTPAPRAARERACAALETDRLGYTDALGLPALRERIARYYRERYDVGVVPERVVVTSGSSAGFVLAFLAVTPGYPLLPPHPQGAQCDAGADRDQSRSAVDAVCPRPRAPCWRRAGLLFASPNNPTGTMAVGPRLGELADACRRRRLWLISDEIYHGFEYDEPAVTAIAHWQAAIVVNSFSKYFSTTGWRIG
jgi:aspartate/methionine/tyrosine aminotransferase